MTSEKISSLTEIDSLAQLGQVLFNALLPRFYKVRIGSKAVSSPQIVLLLVSGRINHTLLWGVGGWNPDKRRYNFCISGLIP